MILRRFLPALLPIFLLSGCLTGFAEDGDKKVDFAGEILPILSDNCFLCHGPDAKKDALRLDSREGATADLGDYKAIDPEALAGSELIARIFDTEDPMPPVKHEKSLNDAQKNLLKRWVEEGGDYAKHWAFVPPVRDQKKTIDGMIGEGLKTAGLAFAPEAEPAVLARRLALTLIGLPPTAAQIDAFKKDKNVDRLIDELFDDPRYGEHQARYWLDAVRYGDTHGLHLDNKRGIYPYRDWVVRAFNRNLAFDEFILWQLAGDLLPEPSLEQLVATGFVRMNPTTAEGGAIPAEFQAKNNFDRVETLGTVLLGMTLNCVRCHTHKYDPLMHEEYYQMMAFFNSTAEGPMDGNKYEYGPVLKAPADQTAWQQHDLFELAREALLARSGAADKGGWNALVDRKGAFAGTLENKQARELEAAQKRAAAAYVSTLVTRELPKPRVTKVLHRGEYSEPQGEPVAPGVFGVMGGMPEGAPRNRLGLAQWLTAAEHPLTARVLVNHAWQQVFGHGLVRTPEDFGLQGQQPTHPELLDWLALEFVESGWDRQHLLRLMLKSRAFRQSSSWRDGIDDPENRLLARGPSYRLDAEVLRDIGLWASGLMDPHMGGEGVKPYQPAGMWKALAHPASNTKQYQKDVGERLYRRSLYVYWKRTSPHPMMTLFDAPSREASCVRRSRSNTPLQSLGLLNETQRVEIARKLAERLVRERKEDPKRLDHLFTLLASRAPDATERKACEALLASARERFKASKADAEALLATGDATRDEKLSPQDVAAWTQVASVVLASDAAILLY